MYCLEIRHSDFYVFNFVWFSCVFRLPREAEGFKEQGNAYYVKKDYSEAFNYYTKAIGNDYF